MNVVDEELDKLVEGQVSESMMFDFEKVDLDRSFDAILDTEREYYVLGIPLRSTTQHTVTYNGDRISQSQFRFGWDYTSALTALVALSLPSYFTNANPLIGTSVGRRPIILCFVKTCTPTIVPYFPNRSRTAISSV